ncbi:MAG TPA: hypothetical protein VE604_16075, partial [Candidatus Polarisedimenticolia bacterium]|nr:hypothetical protein [Candidatus Polarisedimenticolia bacterium]
ENQCSGRFADMNLADSIEPGMKFLNPQQTSKRSLTSKCPAYLSSFTAPHTLLEYLGYGVRFHPETGSCGQITAELLPEGRFA